MRALLAFARRSIRPTTRAAALLAAVVTAPAWAADTMVVMLDQATITKMPERASTLVIGNPLIADVSVQAGGLLVVTGKGYGSTNMIALDRSGAVLAERRIEVVEAQDRIVVVYRGVNRESYSCTPNCEPRITLGDSQDHFNRTMQQSEARSARAQGAAGH